MVRSTVEYSKKVAVDLAEKATMRVLHVDDELDFLKAAKRCLEMQGPFQVDTALSVAEAIEKMKKKTYDAIVCDYIMPRKDGLEFLKELRDSDNNIPFIIFTGKGREDVAIEALNLGADRYFSKIGGPATVYGELSHGIRQVVEIRRADEKLRKSEEGWRESLNKLNLILSTMEDGVDIVTCDYVVQYQNRASKDKFGDLEGKKCYIGRKGLEKPCSFCPMRKSIKYRKTFRVELTGKDGRDFEVIATPLEHPDGHVDALEIVRDITERKKAELSLKESEEKYRNLFENARDVTLTMDLKGKITSINKAAIEYGFKKDEIIGKNQLKFVPKKYWPKLLEELVQIARRKTVEGEVEINTPKGKKVADYRSTPIIIDSKVVGVQTILRDITEQKKAEELLRENEEKYRELINGMNDTAWVIDFDGRFIDVNDAAVEVLGYSREELLSMGPQDIDKNISEEEIRGLIKGMPTDEVQVFETVHTTKDGKKIPVMISSSLVTYQGNQAILSIARDITERKKAEEELKQIMEKLTIANEKLSVVGKMTRHDARNKLSVVRMNAFLARQKLAGDHEASEHLSEIESAVKQTERIFDFARIYETLGVEKLTYVDVAKIVEEATKMFSDLLNISVVNDCHGLKVLADSLLRQILYNLIHNSLTHGEKVSQIRVYYEEAGKDQLKLVYEDDGVGVPKAEKEKIFEKGYGKGTGYGLYLMRKMCEVYGWTAQETGKQGKGAQFSITIPKTSESGKMNFRLH